MPQPISVSIPRRLVTSYKIRAAKAWPLEFIAFPLGRKNEDGGIEILGFYYPPDWRDFSKEGQVEVASKWWIEALEVSIPRKMCPLGTIHSHCYRVGATEFDEVQSLGDLASWDIIDRIAGIANVCEQKNGTKKCGDIHWHGPPTLTEVTIK